MKYHKPSFFDQFKCIGSACTDTCCAGWEIEVDETTAEGYLTEKGAFGDRLRREIGSEPGEYFFKLQDNRCPFLNKENLCDIFINLGEDRLCDICREHPRFYNWFGDYTEVGLGLCCEEAERLLFSDSKPLTFVEEVTQDEEQDYSDEDEYTDASDLILPDVICNKQQLEYIEMVEARPNFITSEIVTGAVVVLEDEESKRDDAGAVDVADKIVVIPKADPGYDWIFAKGIRGFITKYGGVASHMAIRCAEFNIPAAIGCGDVIYNYVTGLDKLTLDCKNGKILKEE